MTNRGRPRISDFCNDCFREGKVPPEANPKEGSSAYCIAHQKLRQSKYRINKTQRKPVRHGKWGQIPDTAREHLADNCRKNITRAFAINEAYGDPVQIALHKPRATTEAFEWSCQEMAIQLSRRLTVEEEDEIIALYGGSRTGEDAFAPMGPGGVIRVGADPTLLPNPKYRTIFRAQNGGPTTEGEPSFTSYYEQHYGKEPPAELREPVDPEEYVQASDGMQVKRKMLEGYELAISRGTKPKSLLEGDPEEMVRDPESGGMTARKNLKGYEKPDDGEDYFGKMDRDVP